MRRGVDQNKTVKLAVTLINNRFCGLVWGTALHICISLACPLKELHQQSLPVLCAIAPTITCPPSIPGRTTRHVSLYLRGVSMVCKLCRDDVGRALRDTNYVPRWNKATVQSTVCSIRECQDVPFTSTNMASDEQRHGRIV